ncbi:MAG: tetratricopeptide repeat protein, partial [Chitinispirillaceae bacterium]|nr:tetratricopeptide repeat protein [Chitinispirillaceae bacterium]
QTGPISIGKKQYTTEFSKGKGWVIESGPSGTKKYKIEQVLGGKDVYYFLTRFESGHLQTLPVGFDSRQKKWFDVAESAVRHAGGIVDSALHWTDRAYTFNTSCYSCHVSQLKNSYDEKTDTYRTAWEEPGINCETCHGPSSEHNKAFKLAGRRGKPKDLKLISMKNFTHEQVNAQCSFCHAKMMPISNGFMPGDKYFDHFDLTTMEDQDFYPDGRELGECYTYTTWRTSPCVKSGQLDCMHCHTSSGRYRFHADSVANNACMPCHQGIVEKPSVHHRHSDKTKCISCHLPMTEFGRMRRSDHSLRPPTPATSMVYGSPNACILCHTDKKDAWADSCVRKWHKDDYQAPYLYRAALIAEARHGDWGRLEEMLAYIADTTHDEMYANGLIRLLRNCNDQRKWPALIAACTDKSPLIRSSAADACGSYYTSESVAALVKALRDDYRLVRIRAVYSLFGAPKQFLSDPVVQADMKKAESEFLAAMGSRLDNANNRLTLGNYHMALGRTERAIDEFESAIRLRPEIIAPWVNAAFAYNQAGNAVKTEKYLRKAVSIDPNSAIAHQNLALFLGEQQRFKEAAEQYRSALILDSTLAVSAYNLAVISDKSGSIDDAVRYSERAALLAPQDPKNAYTAAYYKWKQGRVSDAITTLEQLINTHPSYFEAHQLCAELYRQQGNSAKAADLMRRGNATQPR